MISGSRLVANQYLSENTFKLIKYGFFAVHKRPGLTSAKELEELKNAILKDTENDVAVRKNSRFLLRAGHGGTLDSMATGVLAVALCDGCKILPVFLASSKRYTVTARLGAATDTYNLKGKVITETAYEHVTKTMLEQALTEFVGEIWQKPPAYSALKVGGRRASDWVRLGQEVNLTTRPVTCHSARCVGFEPPYFTLDVSCGQGFYVRSLVHDLAEAVGSSGHVTDLVRTKHGPFTLSDCLQPQHYSLNNIVAAINEVQVKHPKLAQQLKNYWKNVRQKTGNESQQTSR